MYELGQNYMLAEVLYKQEIRLSSGPAPCSNAHFEHNLYLSGPLFSDQYSEGMNYMLTQPTKMSILSTIPA